MYDAKGWSNGHTEWSDMAGGPAGERLIPHIIEDYAKHTPDRVWVSVAREQDVAMGFVDITFAQLAHCINYVAWEFDATIGRSHVFETLAYMGNPDFRYLIFVVAAMKCGYQALLPSPRNSSSGNYNLLDLTQCTKFFYSDETQSRVLGLKESIADLEFYRVPSFDEMMNGRARPFSYEKSFWEAIKEPAFICQTSGSTSLPKPIIQTNGLVSVLDNHRKVPPVPGRRNMNFSLLNFRGGGRYFSPFPPFHVAGILGLIMPLLYNCTVVLALGDRPPSGEMVSQIMNQMTLRSLYCPPTIFEELIREPEGLKQMSKLDFVIFTGGPLSPETGNELAKVTTVCQLFGSTETGSIPALIPERENWPYFEWHPVYQLDMQEVYPGSFEMVIPRNPELAWIRTTWHTFPELEEWRTRDLFRKHPTNPNLWTFEGRSDDVVVLSNGEMFNPVAMEGTIKDHPLVSEALIVGHGRFQAALLIEPRSDAVVGDSLITNVMPIVEKANAEGPGHARIFRSKIIVANLRKPFRRTAKNTIIRRLTTEDYAQEIEAVYSGAANTPNAVGTSISMLTLPLSVVEELLKSYVAQLLPQYDGAPLDSDFYVLGLDSLQTIELASQLRFAMAPYIKVSGLSSIDAKAIYAHASVKRLANHMYALMNSGSELAVAGPDDERIARMSAMVSKYTVDIPQRAPNHTPNLRPRSERLSVVLTGSTGTLGTNMLRTLLADPTVAKIYCLNRSSDARKRHEDAGLKLNSLKVEFLTAEFGTPQFGLSPSKLAEVKDVVDVIIHNAWKVNFHHSLQSFEDVHIRGVRCFIDWSLTSPRNPHVVFVSSVGSVARWNTQYAGPVLEKELVDYRVAARQGYSESKHVAERILQIAAERAGLSTSLLRVGQISGPMEIGGTSWNRHEWLPSLVQTSQALARIPANMMDVDWTPVDALARVICDIAHTGAQGLQVFNLVNPRTEKWSTFVHTIQRRYPEIKAIPLGNWVSMIKGIDANNRDEVARYPGVKLIEFYDNLADAQAKGAELTKYETGNAERVSRTMRELGPVREEWMQLWLDQWSFGGQQTRPNGSARASRGLARL